MVKCQHVGDGGVQCEQDATRDIKVRSRGLGWKFFLCDSHQEEVRQQLRAYIDKVAHEQITQDTNSPIEKG